MPRKIIHIILSLLLFISTTGVSFSMHYCKGKLVSASIITKAKTCCNGVGKCCENKVIHYELENDYLEPLIVSNSKATSLYILLPILFAINFSIEDKIEPKFTIFEDSSPPPLLLTRLALLQTYIC